MRLKYWMCEIITILIILTLCVALSAVVCLILGDILEDRKIASTVGFLIGLSVTLLSYYPIREYLLEKYGDIYD